MIQNKDKALVKTLRGLLSGKNNVLDLLKDAQTDRERILYVFLISIGCEKVLGLEPKPIFDKLLKYTSVEDVNSIITKEYEKKLETTKNKITDGFKEILQHISGDMIKAMNDQLDEQNRIFVTKNQDKFVLVKPASDTDKDVKYYTTEEGDGCFDNDIMYAKTFESFDEADQYRKSNNLDETLIYSVEDCGNLIE
jgi:hypothetical protein